MAHGYLGNGYGSHGDADFDREDRERDQDWRERASHDRDRDWSDRNRDRDRDRGFMFGDRSDSHIGREQGGFGSSGDFMRERRSFSAHPDDHYRSWRDRQVQSLDRDYADYCQEREQQFHRDFDQWRQRKYGNPQPLRTGMTQSGISHDPSGMTQAVEDGTGSTPVASDPTATATLGTNSGGGGRSRR